MTRWRARGRFTVLTGLALTAALAGAATAQADPYPVDGGPDKGSHSFCFDPAHTMAEPVRKRAVRTMGDADGVEAQTVVDTVRHAPCRARTDVVYQQRPLGAGVLGFAPCVKRVSGSSRCDTRHVRIYWAEIQRLAPDANFEARTTLCHEVGHTLGLNHYASWIVNPDGTWAPQSCMTNELSVSGQPEYHRYGPHHRAHVNNWF